ncbi:MAG: apolipoprotein N-acyltransferase [Cyanosarcina radialis HA8281-LM2]|nr:apolipoprotein N-acyltransferase [Cyanosarcina radialis HA8281-LM2]
MGLATAPVSAWFLPWIALAPLWVLVIKSQASASSATKSSFGRLSYQVKSQKSVRERGAATQEIFQTPNATNSCIAWGIGYHGLALFWITGIHPMTWMGVPWLASLAIAAFCWLFITMWGAVLVAIWGACQSRIGNSLQQRWGSNRQVLSLSLIRVLTGTALWCGLEALWSNGPLWWTSLSYTQSPHNLAILHLGQLSGPSTVTAAIVAVNGLLAEAWIHYQAEVQKVETLHATSVHKSEVQKVEDRRQETGVQNSRPLALSPHLPISPSPSPLIAIALTLLLGLHLLGFFLYSRPLTQSADTALKVGIIQGNIPNTIKLYAEGIQRAIAGYTSGYETLADRGVDAVLTPEGALPFLWDEVKESPFYRAVLAKKVVAWLGSFYGDESQYTNSLLNITGTGEVTSRYGKVKLVPLGEYIPFEQFLGGIINRLSPLEARQIPGSPNQLFDTPFGRAIVGICYESAFSEQFRYQAQAGGQFILSPSNDAHYSAAMPAQHHALDVMRAIETDRWAVRATNTGYSAIVNPHGETLWLSNLNAYQIHDATIYRLQSQTLYVRWGDRLTPILLISAALAWSACKSLPRGS